MIDLADLRKRMEGAFASLHKELSGLRTGRASGSLVEGVMVEVYGNMMPLNQVASISVPEPRMITLQVWDKSATQAVEKAIINANLGLNPSTDGQLIRLPIPDLTEERRREMVKIGSKYLEQSKIAVRNIRRDGMDDIKKGEKDGKLSQDEARAESDKVQKLTDEFIEKMDAAFHSKEQEIIKV